MPELARPDATLHYEVSGDGPPLMMIAGFMSDSASWAPLLPLLEPHFTLIRPDNRTTGQTRPWNAPVSYDYWVEDSLALLEHLDTGPAHLLGHSLGGLIAWGMARRAPETIASCMTMGSAPIALNRNFDLFRALLRIRTSNAPADTWLRMLFPWLFPLALYEQPGFADSAAEQSLAYPHAQSAPAMTLQLDTIASMEKAFFDTTPTVPFRCILGRDDLLVPIEKAQTALTGSECDVIDDAGHSIHWSQPEKIATLVRTFITAHPINT